MTTAVAAMRRLERGPHAAFRPAVDQGLRSGWHFATLWIGVRQSDLPARQHRERTQVGGFDILRSVSAHCTAFQAPFRTQSEYVTPLDMLARVARHDNKQLATASSRSARRLLRRDIGMWRVASLHRDLDRRGGSRVWFLFEAGALAATAVVIGRAKSTLRRRLIQSGE